MKTKSVLLWFIYNCIFCTSIYYGYFENILGFQRIVLFWTIFTFILSLTAFNATVFDKLQAQDNLVPLWLDNTVNLLVIITLIWYGALFIATLLSIQSCIHYIVLTPPKKRKE